MSQNIGPIPNPYQPPVAIPPYGYPGGYIAGPMPGGLWRMGDTLVMHKLALLPDVCVKSGEVSAGRISKTFNWIHPAAYLAILGGVIPFAILWAIFGQRATISIGLSARWLRKRRMSLTFGWLAAILGIVFFFASTVLAAQEFSFWGAVLILGIALVIFGYIYSQVGARLVRLKRIDQQFVWLKGVHPDVLSRLPEWPSPM